MHPNLKHKDFHHILWDSCDRQRIPLPGVVHLWKSSLNATKDEIARYWNILSEDEKDRARRFYFEKDQNHFVKCRGILKTLIGNYLSLDIKKISFEYEELGKPFLINEPLQFSVSHSAGHALFAFRMEDQIGVDIEKINTSIEIEKLMIRFFSKNEANVILSLDEKDRATSFFKCWTRKESFIKAHGHGLTIPLDRFEVSILDQDKVRLKNVNWKGEVAIDWSMDSFEPEEGWMGAITAKGLIEKVYYYKYSNK